jgi:hypothetical protein
MTAVKFDDPEEFGKWLGKKMERVAQKAVLAVAHRVVNKITTQVIPAESPQPVDRGAYRAAWRARKADGGAMISNTMPYASVIEYGARAENVKIGRAMIDALAAWVKRKGLVGKGSSKAEARSLAWAIATTMKKKGIFNRGSKGLRILEKALKGVEKLFGEELAREIRRAL